MRRSPIKRKAFPRGLFVEALEARMCLAASVGWDGPGLGAAALSYYIAPVPSGLGLDQAAVETAIETALNAWSQVADITFTQTTLARQTDSLDIRFTSLDGTGGVLAQAYLPDDVNPSRLAGDIQFDASERWEIGNSLGSAAFDLVYVAAHEIGHALGLDHLNVAGAVMRPSVSPTQSFRALAAADVDAILALYASADREGDGTSTAGDDGGASEEQAPEPEETPPIRRVPWWRWWSGGGRGRLGAVTVEVTLADTATRHNASQPQDVNQDGHTSALDALLVINDLHVSGSRDLSSLAVEPSDSLPLVDVNGDNQVSALDALLVINALVNAGGPAVSALAEASNGTTDEQQLFDNSSETASSDTGDSKASDGDGTPGEEVPSGGSTDETSDEQDPMDELPDDEADEDQAELPRCTYRVDLPDEISTLSARRPQRRR